MTGWDADLSKRVSDAVGEDATAEETLLDSLAGIDGWVDAVGRVAFPVISAAIRERIAAEIDALAESLGPTGGKWEGAISGLRRAAIIARDES